MSGSALGVNVQSLGRHIAN